MADHPTMTGFIYETVRPTLHEMDMWSPAAEKLLVMIAAHESMGLRYRKQIGGPALSFFQIEPATFHDVCSRYLGTRPGRQKLIEGLLDNDSLKAHFLAMPAASDLSDWQASEAGEALLDALTHDDRFACGVARMRLAMIPAALPDVEDSAALAQYAKTYWNGPGKATPDEYLNDFERYRPDARPIEWGQPV